jgi:hypothetical protein
MNGIDGAAAGLYELARVHRLAMRLLVACLIAYPVLTIAKAGGAGGEVVLIIGILFAFLRSTLLFLLAARAGMRVPWAYGILGFVPVVWLVSLVLVNGAASQRLRQVAGVEIGMFGVDQATLDRLRVGADA